MRLAVSKTPILIAACLLASGPLGACGGDPPRRPPPEGIMAVAARLAPPPARAVEIAVGNVPPGRRIERVVLIDPEGTRHPAPSLAPISATEGGVRAGPSIGVAVTGGSSSRIAPSISLGWNVLGRAPERTSRRVEARVPIPDPAAYRTQASRWRVEVAFTEIDGARRTLTFPAQPP